MKSDYPVCTKTSAFVVMALLGWAAVSHGSAYASEGAAVRPNIVFILLDDVGYNVFSPYGGVAFDAPNIDQLAAQGLVFTHCHSRAMCAPTRHVFTTGKHLGRGHVNDLRPTIAHILKQAGYATCISGKWMMGRMEPWARGFDEGAVQVNGFRFWSPHVVVHGSGGYLKEHNLKSLEGRTSDYKWPIDGTQPGAVKLTGEYGPDVACRFACDFIERHRREPFFVYYAMKLGHAPIVPTPLTPMGDAEKALIDEFATRQGDDFYGVGNKKYEADNIHYADLLIGKVAAKLDELGLRENTLLIVSSDNGPGVEGKVAEGQQLLPGYKGGAHEAATRVPCIISWPAVVKAGTRCDDLVDFTDFLPTFAEAAGASLPAGEVFDGRSFLPQIRGERGTPREWIYFHGGAHPVHWKRTLSGIVDYEEPKPWICRYILGLRYKLYGDGRFYDLQSDLDELHPIKPGAGTQDAELARETYQRLLDGFSRDAARMSPEPKYTYK
ncbi:MAG: sulfatase-like hydrolase/transferase [Planctomycetota bacterium]